MDFVVILIAIIYSFKLGSVYNKDFSGPEEKKKDFESWRWEELRRLKVFVSILWVWVAIEALAIFPKYYKTRNDEILQYCLIAIPVLIVAIIIYTVMGSEARRLKKLIQ